MMENDVSFRFMFIKNRVGDKGEKAGMSKWTHFLIVRGSEICR